MTFAETIASDVEACAATLSFDAAQAILAANVPPLGVERVPLAKAGRRVLAEPVNARSDAPRYDAAAMDGFAVRDADLSTGLRQFRVVGAAYPAAGWSGTLGRGEAVRIMTGAAIPTGADRVLVREHVSEGDAGIALTREPALRNHVRARASDMACGDRVLAAGRTLDPLALLVAAAADVASVSVWRRPRVRVITSGDELVAPGAPVSSRYQVPDSLSEALLLLVRQYGGVPVGAARVRDNAADLGHAASAALQACDVLVMAGGASRGDRDFSKLGLKPLGLELGFADVAIKPGKPVWYGRLGDHHVLGIPGNPTAAMTVARLFLVPLLAALEGRGFAAGLDWTQVPLVAPLPEGCARETFLCAEWNARGVQVIERQSASAQLLLGSANALVRRAPLASAASAGDLVAVLRF